MTAHDTARSPKPLPKPPVTTSPQHSKPPLPKPPLPKRPAQATYASAFLNPHSITSNKSPPVSNHATLPEDTYHAPYRSPEKVEDDEVLPPAHGLITEHVEFADEFAPPPGSPPLNHPFNHPVAMEVDDVADKAQVGPGVLPRRLLDLVHPHTLIRPTFDEWSKRESTLKPAQTIDQEPATPVASTSFQSQAALEDVIAAVPGGSTGEWYFCTECWLWLRVSFGHGEVPSPTGIEACNSPQDLQARQREISRFNDLLAQRTTLRTKDHHFHGFELLIKPTDHEPHTLYYPSEDPGRVDRAALVPDAWVRKARSPEESSSTSQSQSTLYVSCCSDAWLLVDHDTIQAQIPKSLADQYTKLRADSPAVGWNAERSVFEGWSIWALLLSNAAIEGDTRWCSITSKSFQKKAGWGIVQSHLADAVHFGLENNEDKSRIGPLTDAKHQKDQKLIRQCMLRAWVEISLHIYDYFFAHEINGVAVPIGLGTQALPERMSTIMDGYPYGPRSISADRQADLDILGASPRDVATSIVTAYELQLSCDSINAPDYLGALQAMGRAILPDADIIAIKAATESSMGKFSKDDLVNAYAAIGYDAGHAEAIGVEAADSPDTYVFKLYRDSGAKPNADRQRLQEALTTIARARQSDYLLEIAATGSSGLLSLAEAYRALSAPEESVDEGIIMQYQMAIKDYPHRKEHYKMCMMIIAHEGGDARAGIRFYLDKGELDVTEQPVRKDIPVGLHNIGNTCYLNSILQYLYSITPLREAVINFDKPLSAEKAEVERSRRFVRQLRDLFLQLGRSDLAAIRPEQELAYLAITRPEDDDNGEPPIKTQHPSPSSTRVNSPVAEAEVEVTLDSMASPTTERPEPLRQTSVLGKRASQDRENDDEPAAKSEKMDVDIQEVPEQLPSPPTETVALPPPLPPRPKPFNPNSLKFGLQQDSAEVLINVLNQLELALDPVMVDGVEINLVQRLFSCKFRQQTVYSDQEAQTPVESVFVPPILGVEEEGKDVYDCLGELYLQGEEIEYEGRKGVKMDLMDALPPLLYVQMRRSQYDFTTGRESKLNTHVAFDRTLIMDRFMADADPERRQQSIELTRDMAAKRSRLHYLNKAKPMDMPSTFTHVRDALSGLDLPEVGVTEGLLEALVSEADRIRAEIKEVEASLRVQRERLDCLWEGSYSMAYELMAVFMHRGKSSGAGHYWTYQAFLPDEPDRFFKYNDAEVTEVPMSEVLQDRTGQDANPALLCYVRKGTGLVQTLCRQ